MVTTSVVMLTVKSIHYCVVNSTVVTITTSCIVMLVFSGAKVSHYTVQNLVLMSYNISNFEFDQAAARIIFL